MHLAASSMLKLIIVLLYIRTLSLLLIKPMPPMSAARLYTSLQPSHTRRQLLGMRRSAKWNSSQNSGTSMNSLRFQSAQMT